MKTGLGIDTGGTYTDAAIYDYQSKQVLHAAKSLTTREDLAHGIGNVLKELPREALQNVDIVSLSTTLATNACVEDKGWRAKLVFLGVDPMLIEKYGRPYGMPSTDEIYFLNGGVKQDGTPIETPDWEKLERDMPSFLKDADAVAIVEMFGSLNTAGEKKAKEIIQRRFDMPAICGHELFVDLNVIKRAASTLLNARLIPIIEEFIRAIKRSLKEKNITAPLVIVRSDCTLMTDEYTTQRPVDTLLCGPAASVLGGTLLADEQTSVIVDMGGTTTDIAIVENGLPDRAKDGVDVGKWQTFVKAVQVDTIGLGGDSRIRFDATGNLSLGPQRVMPLCMAAVRWPQMTARLEKLAALKRASTLPLHEFLCLMKPPVGELTEREERLVDALEGGPLILQDAATALKVDVYNLRTERLERQGAVMRAGLTPTDLMHLGGDFERFDKRASEMGAAYLSGANGMTADALIELVYNEIRKMIYTNIVSRLLKKTHPKFRKDGLGVSLNALIDESWHRVRAEKDMLDFTFRTDAALVGLGGPVHIFLGEVAQAMGTRCVIPRHASVANAVGAVVGNVSATAEVQVHPEYDAAGLDGYRVLGTEQSRHEEKEDAVAAATRIAKAQAREEAARRGAAGKIIVHTQVDENDSEGMCLGITVSARAVGSFGF